MHKSRVSIGVGWWREAQPNSHFVLNWHCWQEGLWWNVIKCQSQIHAVMKEIQCAFIFVDQHAYSVTHLQLDGAGIHFPHRKQVTVFGSGKRLVGIWLGLHPLSNTSLAFLPWKRVNCRHRVGQSHKTLEWIHNSKKVIINTKPMATWSYSI